uniref:Chemosensory protein n=1 Tax=Histia rhodope TaxID=1453155 RepID=A0A6M9BJJ5_9NEOP|nr:chemosensory protein [Histia rhodope]
MRYTLILVSVVLTSIASYPIDYDAFDQLNNPEIVQGIVKCFLDEGICNGIAEFYKPYVQEIVRTACAYCNDRQKTMAGEFFSSFRNNFPELMKTFAAKYDPEGKYIPQLFKSVNA